MSSDKRKEAGIMRTISGREIDLTTYGKDDIDIFDIAWGLGRTLRYNGHMVEDYMVAHHCVIMSYLVDEEYALEALLHDAAETYLGDIIWPVKALFNELSEFEDRLMYQIMKHFKCESGTLAMYGLDSRYAKSKVIEEADRKLYEHECFEIGRPGTYHEDVESAWIEAINVHQEYWMFPAYAYVQRFRQLMGDVEEPLDLQADGTIDYLSGLWYKEKPEAVVANNELLLSEFGSVDAAFELYADNKPMTPSQADLLRLDWNEYQTATLEGGFATQEEWEAFLAEPVSDADLAEEEAANG